MDKDMADFIGVKPILTIDCKCEIERNNKEIQMQKNEPRKKLAVFKCKSQESKVKTMVQIRMRESQTLLC
jgi:hypothetical protein